MNMETKDITKEFYAFLTSYYLHQDRISVDRIRTLIAVEGATLAGAFALRIWPISIFVLIVGTMMIECIWRMCERDWDIRDNHILSYLDKFHIPLDFRFTNPASMWHRATFLMPKTIRFIEFVNILFMVLLFLYHIGIKSINLKYLLGISQNL